jgi:major membrane immunogen (membrane-anchored lipoprotein)
LGEAKDSESRDETQARLQFSEVRMKMREVKDPNLVGALSGHKEGSKAFARYRDIDEEMKRELIGFLD